MSREFWAKITLATILIALAAFFFESSSYIHQGVNFFWVVSILVAFAVLIIRAMFIAWFDHPMVYPIENDPSYPWFATALASTVYFLNFRDPETWFGIITRLLVIILIIGIWLKYFLRASNNREIKE